MALPPIGSHPMTRGHCNGGSKFGIRYLALHMAFVQRLVLIVAAGRCGIGLAHHR